MLCSLRDHQTPPPKNNAASPNSTRPKGAVERSARNVRLDIARGVKPSELASEPSGTALEARMTTGDDVEALVDGVDQDMMFVQYDREQIGVEDVHDDLLMGSGSGGIRGVNGIRGVGGGISCDRGLGGGSFPVTDDEDVEGFSSEAIARVREARARAVQAVEEVRRQMRRDVEKEMTGKTPDASPSPPGRYDYERYGGEPRYGGEQGHPAYAVTK